jgi:mRNA interferase MazF
MAERLNRGEIWLLRRARPDKRRPVLVLSRPSLIQLLHTVTVAAITSTLRGAPTEVELGIPEGLKATSCVNLCNLFTVRQQELTTFVGTVPPDKMAEVCRALTIACACDLPERVTGAVGDNRRRGVDEAPEPEGLHGFEPLPRRGPAVSNELIDRLREEEPA